MSKRPYIIMAPPYRHNSAGVRALYELQRHLEERGYEATICQSGNAPHDAIVVYPETVSGNPLNGKIVVRYVLNYPGFLGGDKEYDKEEIIFTYTPAFYPGAPVLTVPVIEDFFRNENLPRSGGCFWVGKGFGVPRVPETEGLTEITYDWPGTREELARLFNRKESFYSYDNNSALLKEAERCGCKVVVIGKEVNGHYDELEKEFHRQLDEFIKITQRTTESDAPNVFFGVMVSDAMRLDMCLKQSPLVGNKLHYVSNPESATKGLNILLEKAAEENSDIAILVHQDVYLRQGWLDQVKKQIKKLPENWLCCGVIGKDMQGRIAGKFWDHRIPLTFDTSNIHTFPQPACCFDEAVIIINMKTGFRFDESFKGFDLYGTICVLQAWESGHSAWVIDCFTDHYCLRSFSWHPDDLFCENYKRLYDKYKGIRVDSTALGLPPDGEVRFETSAAPEEVAA